MALEPQQISFFKFFVRVVIFVWLFKRANGQQSFPGNYYPQNNEYNVYDPYYQQNNPERDYSTYTYNSRRYGQYQPNYNGRGRPGDPRYPGEDVRFSYDRVSSVYVNESKQTTESSITCLQIYL